MTIFGVIFLLRRGINILPQLNAARKKMFSFISFGKLLKQALQSFTVALDNHLTFPQFYPLSSNA